MGCTTSEGRGGGQYGMEDKWGIKNKWGVHSEIADKWGGHRETEDVGYKVYEWYKECRS